jgi:hypothetical protein
MFGAKKFEFMRLNSRKSSDATPLILGNTWFGHSIEAHRVTVTLTLPTVVS